MTLPEFAMNESDAEFLQKIDDAIEEAARVLDLCDAPKGDDLESEERREEMFEDRFHCGVCTVRVVMETIWPSIEEYIGDLKAKQIAAEFVFETRIVMDSLQDNRQKYGYKSHAPTDKTND
jgi:hypothetical protein